MNFRRLLKPTVATTLFAASATLFAAAVSNLAPKITTSPYPIAKLGQTYQYGIRATDPEGSAVQYSVAQGPNGMSYDSSAKATRWTPTQLGLTQVAVRASDNWGAYDEQQYSLRTVADFCELYPITIPQQIAANARSGQVLTIPRGAGAGNFSWLTWNGDVDVPTLSASLLPPGDSFNYINPSQPNDHVLDMGDWAQGATGAMVASEVRARLDALKTRDIIIPTWSGVRAHGANFDYSVAKFAAVRIKDYDLAGHGWMSFEFKGFRECYNDAPVANNAALSTPEDQSLAIALPASDPDGDALSFTITAAPSHGQLQGNGANVVYAPNADYVGSDSFSFVASDGRLTSGAGTVSITVTPVNDAPVARNLSLDTDEDVAVPVLLLADDRDGDALQFQILQAPTHGTLVGSGASLQYVPNQDFSGTDSFTWRASDGSAQSSVASVDIVVHPLNDAPVVSNSALSTAEDQSLPIVLQGNDPDHDALSFTILTPPAHGHLEGSGANLSYVPDADYFGADAFSFVASDGQLNSGTGTVAITVTPANDAPVARNLSLDTDEDVSLPVLLLADDRDGDALQFQILQPPLHGSLVGTGASLVYFPAANFHGTDSFTWVAKDASAQSSVASVDIVVHERNLAPTAVPRTLSVAASNSVAVELAGTDPDGDALNFRVINSPSSGSLSGLAPHLVYAATANFSGVVSFSYVANDGRLDSPPVQVSITVEPGNHAPTITSLPGNFVPERGAFQYQLTATDPDAGDFVVWSAERLLPGLAVNANSGRVDWPASGLVAGVREKNLVCRTPSPAAHFDPKLKWWRSGPETASGIARVLGPALVAELNDDNGDGKIDTTDQADVISLSNLREDSAVSYLVAMNGKDGSVLFQKQLSYAGVYGAPALGDIDGDGKVEIAVLQGVDGNTMTLLENDGTVKWSTPVTSHFAYQGWSRDALAIGDLDADGTPEIVRGATIVNGNGTVRCRADEDQGGVSDYAYIPVIADINLDGKQEIIAGRSIYNSQCQRIRQLNAPNDGYVAVGNFDADPYPEIVLMSNGSLTTNGRLYLFNHDGGLIFGPVNLPGGGAGGPPTLANIDSDPYPEIASAGRSFFTVFDNNGAVLWSNPTQDFSSHETGSTFFDFEGDGRSEVLYGDEVNFFIWDGATGERRYSVANPSGTAVEYPVVADLDGDGSAEVLVGMDAGVGGGGIRVFTSESGAWTNARPLWNQHASSITNINDDGTIPRNPEPSWLAHNTYRLNSVSRGHALGQADLAVFDLRLDPVDESTVRLTAINRGLAATEGETLVRIRDGAGANGRVVGTVKLPVLASGQSINVSLSNVDAKALGDELVATIDEVGAVAECLEDNNSVSARVFHVRATDRGGLFDQQVFTVGLTDVNEAPVFESSTPPQAHIGHAYSHRVLAHDPDLGEGLTYSLVSGPIGMTVEAVSGELRWTPVTTQSGSHNVVVKVSDLRGLSATRALSVLVPANSVPVFTSTPGSDATALQPYSYDANAEDADGDLLSFSLSNYPQGMTINGATGLISWTPTMEQGGPWTVIVSVTDPFGGSREQPFTINVALPANHAPAFDSTAVTAIALGQRYEYQANANDPDGDALQYTMLEAPAGMLVDTVTGFVVWQPRSDQVGAHTVRLQAADPRGGTDVQQFTVFVSAGVDSGNHPPSISSLPTTSALLGAAWTYQVAATDLDGDGLNYSLAQSPAGMQIDAQSGALNWTPTPAQAGLNAVAVVVDDGRGGTTTQSFSILAASVGGGQGNRPPSITSDPLTLVTLGDTYRYYVSGSDPDGDALSFELVQAPAGMSINAATGAIAWTPPAPGQANVSVRVSDGRGGSTTQSFVVSTVATGGEIDHRPVVTGAPATDAKVGVPYVLPLQVVDADGDAMHYELREGPAGASVDAQTGVVSWTPAAEGTEHFVVRVISGDGYTDISWNVVVQSAETPLTLHVVANPERVAPGAAYVAGLEFHGAAGPVTISADLSGQPVTLDSDGQTTLSAPLAPGFYQLNVRIDDGHANATDSADLFVSDSGDSTPPTVSLNSPGTDARITAPTAVIGAVYGSDVARWKLSLLDKATGASTPIAEGDSAAGPGVLGKLDPTLSTNGFYTVLLQAWDASGNLAQDSRTVLIDGDMKLGHFSLSFEDVSLPMAGVPIRVTRTYDTRRRNERLDFGYGWSVDYQNLRLTESRAPGFSWSMLSERNGLFGNWCLRANGDPIVAITAPDGKLLKFRAKAMPECQFAAPQPDVQLVFEPLPGTDAQLDQTDYGIVRLTQIAGSGVYSLMDPGESSQLPANPSHYRLKLPDGTVYSITQGVGLTQVSEPDGNTLTYSASGIHHSRGQDITFLRDGLGRIEQVVLPDGRRRRYTYTPAGDLEIAVDTGLDLTSFTYLPQAPHYLRDIVDPRGVHVSRNEYDDDGRLVATIDADGHRIEYTHNLDGRVETIKDRRGYASTYVYDDEGRVTAESNAFGQTTLHKYDANGNELETTDPLLHVTKRSFDAHGNLLTETNPLNEKVVRSYDEHNNLLTQVDALGRTVAKNAYHAYNGKLVMAQDALGNLTSFGYDSGFGTGGTGELLGITDAGNSQTRYEMDFWGHRVREFDAAGNETYFDLDITGRMHGEYRERKRGDGTVESLATQFTLDDKDRVIATLHPDGSRTTVEYDGNGKPTKSCDALQRCTLQSYNARGELERTTYPDATFESSEYDENGNVISRRDRGGHVTKMVYDKANRLVETILPDETPATDADNPRTSSEYDPTGRMKASIDELGHSTEFGYDDAGRRLWVKDALGDVTTTQYNVAGERTAVIDALGRVTRFEYDVAGRLVATVHPDTTPATDADNPRTRTEYDAVGRKLAEIDELGRRKVFGYDPLGRLVTVTLPNPATGLIDNGALVTRYGYDDAGNKVSQTDALGRVTRWEYDQMGRQLRRILPLGQSESMAYDAAGQLKSRTDFKGVTTRYSYDAAGRLAGTDYPTDADVVATYTASGQRESVTDGQGTTLYQYDARDRLLRVQYPDGNAIAYGYDAAGNRAALHSPAQDQAFEFDDLNRLSKVRTRVLGGAERVVSYAYDDVGNRTRLVQADGTNTTTVFDERNRLRQLTTRNAAGVLLFGAIYDLNATGARTGIAEFDASGPTRSVGYAYDGVRRLTAEVITRPGQTSRATEYEYDAVGNRLKKTEGGIATYYLVDENDRLQTETTSGVTTIYTFDDNGNTTGNAKPGESTHYTYDEANRLVRTQNSAGLDVTAGYGAEGVRNRESVNGTSKSWLIDANRDYAQTLEAYVGIRLTTTWAYGSELLSQVSVASGTMHERNLNADGAGSVRRVTDAIGQQTDSFEYDAFGRELSRIGESDIDHRYRGEQVDQAVGLYNMRARWYDAGTGRFTQADSWLGNDPDPASLHKYAFANGNPVSNLDPTGNFSIGEFSVGQSIRSILGRMAIGSITGGLLNSADAYLAGEDVGEAAVSGMVFGALMGPLTGISALKPILSGLALAGGAYGMYDAYSRGDTDLLAFRAVLFVAGPTFILKGFGRTPPGGKSLVYRAFNPQTGEVIYVGITDDLEARAAAHLSKRGFRIEAMKGMENMARDDARNVEQALIEFYGLRRNGGTLQNLINSIAVRRKSFSERIMRGYDLLKKAGYPEGDGWW